MYSSVQRQRSDQCPVYAIWYLTPTGLIPVNGPVSLTRTRFVKPNQPTVIAKGAHPHLSLRGAQRRGNLVDVNTRRQTTIATAARLPPPYQVRGRNDKFRNFLGVPTPVFR
jgi:hypothetical protein